MYFILTCVHFIFLHHYNDLWFTLHTRLNALSDRARPRKTPEGAGCSDAFFPHMPLKERIVLISSYSWQAINSNLQHRSRVRMMVFVQCSLPRFRKTSGSLNANDGMECFLPVRMIFACVCRGKPRSAADASQLPPFARDDISEVFELKFPDAIFQTFSWESATAERDAFTFFFRYRWLVRAFSLRGFHVLTMIHIDAFFDRQNKTMAHIQKIAEHVFLPFSLPYFVWKENWRIARWRFDFRTASGSKWIFSSDKRLIFPAFDSRTLCFDATLCHNWCVFNVYMSYRGPASIISSEVSLFLSEGKASWLKVVGASWSSMVFFHFFPYHWFLFFSQFFDYKPAHRVVHQPEFGIGLFASLIYWTLTAQSQ